jgi:hypothetical protein
VNEVDIHDAGSTRCAMRLLNLMMASLLTGFLGAATADAEYDKFLDDVAKGKLDDLIEYKPASLTPKYAYDKTAHSNCVLENGKNARTPAASVQISNACRHKATPKKCRDVSAMPPDTNSKSPQEVCVEGCKSEGMWSRKYGECSLD